MCIRDSIIGAFINGKAIADYGTVKVPGGTDYLIVCEDESGSAVDFSQGETVTIEPGSSTELTIKIVQHSKLTFTSGTTIELALHSGAGNSYMKMVTLT